MCFAPDVGCLAFDLTRISAVNVDFSLDVVFSPRIASASLNTVMILKRKIGQIS